MVIEKEELEKVIKHFREVVIPENLAIFPLSKVRAIFAIFSNLRLDLECRSNFISS